MRGKQAGGAGGAAGLAGRRRGGGAAGRRGWRGGIHAVQAHCQLIPDTIGEQCSCVSIDL